MPLSENISVKEFAKLYDINISTVYKWIKKKKFNTKTENGKMLILNDSLFLNFLKQFVERKFDEGNGSFFPEEIVAYSDWHQTLDYFAWLFKVSYSHPQDVRKKYFNIQYIFENYLNIHKIDILKLKRSFFSENLNKLNITNDLKRGWYNELAFIYPLKRSTLGISFRELSKNIKISASRFSYPSWKISECYYAIYFYFRSIVHYKNLNFRIQEHKTTLNIFKNSILDILKKSLWQFPFNIEYKPKTKFYLSNTPTGQIKYFSYSYCKHPQSPNLLPIDIVKEIYSKFKKRGKRFNNPSHYTIFDFMLEFRVWANYLDIDNLLNLYGEGYKGFLDQNLSLLLFFIGGFSELIYIAVFGEAAYLRELQNLYSLFAKNNCEIKENFINSSVYQRMKIYKFRGIINSEIKIDNKINENEIISLTQNKKK